MTTAIVSIQKDELDKYYYLKKLEIEGNPYLTHLEPGLFRNMSKLEQLSISHNRGLQGIDDGTFEGLTNLKNLTLVRNVFLNIEHLASVLKPDILPNLKGLDISENPLKVLSGNAFGAMEGAPLTSLKINICSLESIDSETFLPLRKLQKLHINQNHLNSSIISNFLLKMIEEGINLTDIDLSGMGFQREPPRELMETIASTTITKLNLAENRFEIISDDVFPKMVNIEELVLNKVYLMFIGVNAFDKVKFPNLKILLLSGNYLNGLNSANRPDSNLLVLDLSSNRDRDSLHLYYEIGKNTFLNFRSLRVLNLAYNSIKTIYNYTFNGLDNLRILNLQNSTLFVIGERTFKSVPHLSLLNLDDNYFGLQINLTRSIFEGLGELKQLTMKNCGIQFFIQSDNIFEEMPNLTTLVLKKNHLRYITPDLLKPLKQLQILDLSDNVLMSWTMPVFLSSGVQPSWLDLANNKITQFNVNMLSDLEYLLTNRVNVTAEIDFTNNVFVCDCISMYKTYMWLNENGSAIIRNYFNNSMFRCYSPDAWQDRKVAEYLEYIPKVNCTLKENVTNIMLLAWSAPTLVTIGAILLIGVGMYKYRVYIRYWVFLSKIALGRKSIRNSGRSDEAKEKDYKYDAFVSYSNEDKYFVAKMVARLETSEPPLKLCIFERDFEIGSFISESVSNCINGSRYIILVISNNFAKSQWCRWETQLAEYHRLCLEDGTTYDPLILIKIGEVESKYLTPSLKYLLKTKIYHTWNEQQSEDFWMKLRNVLKK